MKKIFLAWTFVCCGILMSFGAGVKKVPLAGDWEFRQVGKEDWHPATIPGTVHTDLLANGLIPDPFSNGSEAQLQWIGESDWEYRLRFDIPRRVFRFEHIELVFDGLDTYADIYLNDSLIGSPGNMFTSWTRDVKAVLRQVQNELRLVFHSPIKKATGLRMLYPYRLPAGNDAAEQKTSPYVRKSAYHFGWDWAPRYVSMGIWKQGWLRMWDEIRFVDFHATTQELNDEQAVVAGEALLRGEGNALGDNELKLWLDGEVVWDTVFHPKAKTSRLSYAFSIKNPRRWWPRGHGEPHLYDLKCTVGKNGYVLDSAKVRMGLRRIELVRDADADGTAFYFKVNGKPIFIKGANMVPSDMFLPRGREKMEGLFAAMDAAQFNMVRVWGGGVYGDDALYDWADENGVLVWQDLAFGNGLYPFGKRFYRKVRSELRAQAFRLRNHPSLAIWCGNNEIDVAWHNWGWQEQQGYSAADSTALWEGYLRLFERVIPRSLEKWDSGRAYIPTSPLSNWGKLENFNHHNMHYWGVWHGSDDFNGFRTYVPRFMAEYGFPSFPSKKSLDPFAQGASYAPDSPFMARRQKSYKGNGLIVEFMEDWLGKAKREEDFLVLSQVLQAEGMGIAIRAQRAKAPFCMGTLYWQLNDCWPGASWSTVDYTGAWKAAHYRVCELYKQRMLDVELEKERLVVSLVDEDFGAGGKLELILSDVKGKELWKAEQAVKGSGEMVTEMSWPLEGKLKKVKGKKAVLWLRWSQEGEEAVEMVYHSAKPADMSLKPGGVAWMVEDAAEGVVVRLKAEYFVKALELSVAGVALRAGDNYFDLAPGREKVVEVKEWSRGAEALKEQLELKSLVDWVK